MKVLFIGGSGNISWNCVVQALKMGFETHVLNRDSNSVMRKELPAEVHKIKADINSIKRTGEKYDVIADFICFTPEHAIRDIELFKGQTKQFIFISSASAYQKPLLSVPITEETPLENPYWQYSRNKIACENIFLNEKDFPAVVVRPSHTYDTIIPSAMGSSGWTNSARILSGKPAILHGDGTTLWTLTHAEDFARAFVGLFGNEATIGNAFHITSDELLTWRQITEIVAQTLWDATDCRGAINRALAVRCVPSEVIAEKNYELGAGLLGDKAWCAIFDNSKIKKFVPDWEAKITFKEGIKRTVDWFMEEPKRRVVNAEFDAFLDSL